MQGQRIQGHFSFRTAGVVKLNIAQCYKRRPLDMPEIYQKMVLKWNVESYGSPTNAAQQGIFIIFFYFIFWVAGPYIKKLWLYGIKGRGEGWANTLAVLAVRKARSPAWPCMHVFVHVCSKTCMKERKIFCPCDPSHRLLRVYLCVFFTSISVIDTIKQRKAGGPVLWNNVPSAVWPPAQLLRCRVRRTSDTLKTKYFLRVHVFCCVCLILMACALRFMHARMWNVLLYHFRW